MGPARAALGLAILAVLIGTGRLRFDALSGIRAGPFLGLLAAACGLSLAATGARWACLVRAACPEIPLRPLVRPALASHLFTLFSPAGTGTDAARVVHLVRGGSMSAGAAVAVGLADRLLGMAALSLVGALGAALTGAPAAAGGLGAAGLAIAAVIAGGVLGPRGLARIALLPPRWRARLAALDRPWSPGRVAAAVGAAAISAGANLALPMLGVAALRGGLAGSDWTGSVAAVLVNTVAPTPGGLGAGEAAAGHFLRAGGAEGMLAARVVLGFWMLLFAGLYLLPATTPRGAAGEEA